jgi:threonine synthase
MRRGIEMTQATVTQKFTPTFTKLVSKEGGVEYPLEALYVCEETFSPLEVAYDYGGTKLNLALQSFFTRCY